MSNARIDSTQHSAIENDQTDTLEFSGVYAVNDKEFDDNGNTDRSDGNVKMDMAKHVLEILELPCDNDSAEEIVCLFDQYMIDSIPRTIEIRGDKLDNLIVIEI